MWPPHGVTVWVISSPPSKLWKQRRDAGTRHSRTRPLPLLICGIRLEVDQTAGAPGRDRTADLRFTKPLLYQLSYKGMALR